MCFHRFFYSIGYPDDFQNPISYCNASSGLLADAPRWLTAMRLDSYIRVEKGPGAPVGLSLRASRTGRIFSTIRPVRLPSFSVGQYAVRSLRTPQTRDSFRNLQL
jgi:hypothetical protein